MTRRNLLLYNYCSGLYYNITKAKRGSDWLIQYLLFAHGCMLPMYSTTKAKRALCNVAQRKDFCCSNVSMLCHKTTVDDIACTIELWMHFGSLLSTQAARVALGYRLVALTLLSSLNLPRESITQ